MRTLTTLRTAFRAARANQAAFWTQVAVMVFNDLIWVFFWFVFFDRVASVRGWERDGVLLLLAILATSLGLALGVFSNARHIGRLVDDGGVDAALALPIGPLPHLLTSRVEPINLGDVAFGLVLFAAVGPGTPMGLTTFVVGVICGTAVSVGFFLLVGSSRFFLGRGEAGDLAFQALMVLSNYPLDIFSGATRVVVHTVIPAAFVAAVPAKLVLEPSVGQLTVLMAAAATVLAAGVAAFHAGLRRHTSSAAWTRV